MSKIADRIGSRYDDILAYFSRVPFGSYPPDQTALSDLPPVDRCLILEKLLMRMDCAIPVLVDKLSMAYLKSGWSDLAYEFLDACRYRGLIDDELHAYFVQKIGDLEGVRMSSFSYEQSLPRIQQTKLFGRSPELSELLIDLCRDYHGCDVFSGVSFTSVVDSPDIQAFFDERRAFIHWVSGVI